VIEVFKLDGERTTSMLRLPGTALALPLLQGRSTRFHSDGRGLAVVVSAPISSYRASISGSLVLSTPVDVTAISRALRQHAVRASLTGLGAELSLADSDDPADAVRVTLPIPATGDWSADAAVTATPRPPVGLSWASPARYLSGGFALLLLASFGLARRSHSPA
jgi:hypothetical protein